MLSKKKSIIYLSHFIENVCKLRIALKMKIYNFIFFLPSCQHVFASLALKMILLIFKQYFVKSNYLLKTNSKRVFRFPRLFVHFITWDFRPERKNITWDDGTK